ncbi:conjugal transfer protein [Spirillospora albida]|uniref:conjugal transfer protein n=1 Tax=Spirillospora albida TaxID=58123 RepID=UPI00055E5E4C|nr:conjugal transfer protein [Spirillospora albida]
MARKSAAEGGRDAAGGRGTAVAESAAGPGHALGSSGDPWDAPGGAARRRGGRWGGSGGRWWVWTGRAVLWALILVILVNGIRAPFERFTADDAPASGASGGGKSTGFPSGEASAFALQFATVYLNYDQKNAAAREAQLRTFLPDGTDPQFGWNGVGQLQVQSLQVAGVDARDASTATVTLLARNQDKWLRLAVPVHAGKGGSLVIAGRPALLPPPAKAALPQSGVQDRDTALESDLQSVLGTFFAAYARGDQDVLSRMSDGTAVGGLAGSVNFVQVREVVAPRGDASARTVTATVVWQLPGTGAGGELEQSYRLTLVKKAATWYVRDISGGTGPAAS